MKFLEIGLVIYIRVLCKKAFTDNCKRFFALFYKRRCIFERKDSKRNAN